MFSHNISENNYNNIIILNYLYNIRTLESAKIELERKAFMLKRHLSKNTENEINQEIIKSVLTIEKEIKINDELLTEAYGINIIPIELQNIYAVYFLFDCMLTRSTDFITAIESCDIYRVIESSEHTINHKSELILSIAVKSAENNEKLFQGLLLDIKNKESNIEIRQKYYEIEKLNSDVNAFLHISNYL